MAGSTCLAQARFKKGQESRGAVTAHHKYARLLALVACRRCLADDVTRRDGIQFLDPTTRSGSVTFVAPAPVGVEGANTVGTPCTAKCGY